MLSTGILKKTYLKGFHSLDILFKILMVDGVLFFYFTHPVAELLMIKLDKL